LNSNHIALEPKKIEAYVEAIEVSGGVISNLSVNTEALDPIYWKRLLPAIHS
jgi:hypothetical protein